MSDYIQALKDDLIEQLKDKPNVNCIMEVIGTQLNDVANFFSQLQNERNVSTAVGTQLDGIGNIVALTRAEAAELIGTGKSASTITDDEYRQAIKYKILVNTNNCTYYDLMSAVNMFWDGACVKYSESIDKPATITLDFSAQTENKDQYPKLSAVKPGGVTLNAILSYEGEFNVYAAVVTHRAYTIVFSEYAKSTYTEEDFYQQISSDSITRLTDENTNILSDADGNALTL